MYFWKLLFLQKSKQETVLNSSLLEDINSTDCSDETKPQELQTRDLTPGTFAGSETGTVKCSILRTRAKKRATCAYVHTNHKKKAPGHGKPQREQ